MPAERSTAVPDHQEPSHPGEGERWLDRLGWEEAAQRPGPPAASTTRVRIRT